MRLFLIILYSFGFECNSTFMNEIFIVNNLKVMILKIRGNCIS